jgi:hypothetical protein
MLGCEVGVDGGGFGLPGGFGLGGAFGLGCGVGLGPGMMRTLLPGGGLMMTGFGPVTVWAGGSSSVIV